MKVVVLTADANTLVYHRGDLIRDLAARGCEVVSSAAENHPHVQEFLRSVGGRHSPIRMARSTVNLARDRETFLDMWRLFKREKPDALFAYTIKSVCYGCVVAKLAGVPRIYALLPGLGITFVKQETLKGQIVSRISKALHWIALKCADVIFVQNSDDLAQLREERLVPANTPVHVTAGSGVNLDEFPHEEMTDDQDLAEGRVRFVLVSRLLHSKGVCVFAESARRLKAKYPKAEFHLVGPFDPNPDRVPESDVAKWVEEGTLIHHGMVKDVGALLKKMHVFVLPTWYREGVPHATLEALSMGRAVITTDSIGARETVQLTSKGRAQKRRGESVMQGVNGFLVQPRNFDAAHLAMEECLTNPERIAWMGLASRQLAEKVFDVRIVNSTILRAMNLGEGVRSTPTRVHWQEALSV